MAALTQLIPCLGVGAILISASVTAMLLFFAIFLAEVHSSTLVVCVLATLLGLVGMSLMLAMITYQFWPTQRSPGSKLILTTICICILATSVTIASLAWTCARLDDLPQDMAGVSSRNLVYATFALWAVSILMQFLYLCGSFKSWQRINVRSQSLHTGGASPQSAKSEQQPIPRTIQGRRYESYTTPPQTSTYSKVQSDSETISSLRLSLTQIVRPISSKTRLVTHRGFYRSPSIDSGMGEKDVPGEDAFDSWYIDPEVQQGLPFTFVPPPPPTSSSTANSPRGSGSGRFLETIPASPTASRSPSPGFPLDLEPPRTRRRSRSASPARSNRSVLHKSRAESPSSIHSHQSFNTESHIHPLFRTDSPEPPPNTTPGTVVTAAPGAGQLISDRLSVKRMRSGSLPKSPSPLIHSNSIDGLSMQNRLSVADSDASATSTIREDVEREMTPPIPEWILGAGSRSSMTVYTRRKGAGGGLGAVGEVSEH